MPAGEPAKTPLYAVQKAAAARFVDFAGWLLPVQFQGIVVEHAAVRQRAGLFDVSHMGQFAFAGGEAASVLQGLLTCDVARLEICQGRYTLCCEEDGGIADDLLVYRLAAQRFIVVCNAGNRQKMAEIFAPAAAGRCELRGPASDRALLALQGPQAAAVLAKSGAGDPAVHLRRFGICLASVAGIDCWVARSGYTGEDGFELSCAADRACELWQHLLAAGEAFGLLPVGLGARDTLRLEARLLLHGQDIDASTHPFEAGLRWAVVLDKSDFRGAAALRRIAANGWQRQLVGFEMIGRGIARHGYSVFDPTRLTAVEDATAEDAAAGCIGTVTSGSPSPTLGKNIGLAYVPRSHAAIGTSLAIAVRQQQVEARIVRTPFYRGE